MYTLFFYVIFSLFFGKQEFFLRHDHSKYVSAEVDSDYLEPTSASGSSLPWTNENSSQTDWTTSWMYENGMEKQDFLSKSQVVPPIEERYFNLLYFIYENSHDLSFIFCNKILFSF